MRQTTNRYNTLLRKGSKRQRYLIYIGCMLLSIFASMGLADELNLVTEVEFQPLASATQRLIEALDYLGVPLSEDDLSAIKEALVSDDPTQAIVDIQKILDVYCLTGVNINPESRVKVKEGPVNKGLMQQGWRTFLVKVHNEAGVTAPLAVESKNAAPLYKRSTGSPDPETTVPKSEIPHRFLEIQVYANPPMKAELSGLELEYRIVQLYSRDAGKREATLGFNVGQGTQDIGFRSKVPILFDCVPAVDVTLEVLDFDGKPTTAAFIIRDALNRVYPSRGRRLAPDFFFHNQIYRHSGESVLLPPGNYTVEYTRGPEYRVKTQTITVPNAETHQETFHLERWIHIAAEGWRSGDHHVHAAGCSHYESPTEGVTPEDMMRYILGEDLNVGCVLSWGPCWYYQKQFFDGKVHELSTDDYVMRYDVEVSGFPSSHAGHLSILRLTEDDYNGVERIEEWPSWDLPVLQWAKEQGAVTGFSHSGWGLKVGGNELPNYNMPPFDGIGANEYIVDVVHDAVDFISTVDTPAIWELSIWYHTLNCGFRTRISGETDFPCIYGERVGLGRIYGKMPPGALNFDAWVDGLKEGRSYVGDGKSHLLDFTVGGVPVGEKSPTGEISQLDLEAPSTVNITARVAARLGETPNLEIKNRSLDQQPYWDIERARIEESQKVPVELIVNGQSVETQEVDEHLTVLREHYDALFAQKRDTIGEGLRNLAVVGDSESDADADRDEEMLQIMEMWRLDEEYRKLLYHEPLLDIAESLIGSDIQLFHDQALYKPAYHGGEVYWHQDNAYWQCDPPNLVSIWIALDDADEENGCMNVIPSSYLEGLEAHGRAESEKGKLPALLQVNVDADRAVPVPVKAGCGMVHHCMTLHQTDPNRSSRDRRAMVIHYMSSGTRNRDGEVMKDNPLLRGKLA